MNEIKGTVERVGEKTFNKRDGSVGTIYQPLIGGVTYDCFDSAIKDLVGKELPTGTTAQPNDNPNYNAKLILPKKGGSGGGRSGWQPPDPHLIVLRYATDVTIKAMEKDTGPHTTNALITFTETVFNGYLTILENAKKK